MSYHMIQVRKLLFRYLEFCIWQQNLIDTWPVQDSSLLTGAQHSVLSIRGLWFNLVSQVPFISDELARVRILKMLS